MHRPSNVATATRKKSSIGWVLLACSVAGCKGIDTTEFILGRAGAFELAVRAAQHRHRYLTRSTSDERHHVAAERYAWRLPILRGISD